MQLVTAAAPRFSAEERLPCFGNHRALSVVRTIKSLIPTFMWQSGTPDHSSGTVFTAPSRSWAASIGIAMPAVATA